MNLNLNGMVSMWKMRELVDKATNIVMNYTETEAKVNTNLFIYELMTFSILTLQVREATNDDPWGPSGQQMQEISSCTFAYEAFPEVMGMLWKRMLHDDRQNWRRIYKSLLLLDYLIKNGSERVVTSAREHVYDLRSLENYTHVDVNGKDQGINIRHKVTDMLEFVQDDDRLRDERKKAKKNKDKYIGMSSDAMGFRAGGGSGGGFDDGGWKGFDKSSGGGSTTGRWDAHSDDDSAEVSETGAKEFTDDSFGSEFDKVRGGGGAQLPRQPSGGKSDFEGFKSVASPAKKKPLKKVDLGAAATYAQSTAASTTSTATQQQQSIKNNNILEDLFSDSQPKAGQVLDSQDDFDPRGGSSGDNNISFNAFGDNNNVIKSGDDGFADFSSAFSGGNAPAAAAVTSQRPPDDFDLFKAAPASLQPAQAPASQDLFADFSSAPASVPASANLDLFSGLSSAPAPVLAASNAAGPSFGGFGAFNSPSVAPASSVDLLDGLSMASLPPASMMQPQSGPGNNMLQPHGPPSLPATGSALNSAAAGNTKPVSVGSTWQGIGGLNDSLLNLDLSKGPASRTAAPSMNAMKTVPAGSLIPQNGSNHNNPGAGASLSGLDGLL